MIINRFIRKSYYWYLRPWSFFNDLGVVLILFLWIFHLSWGLNYHRLALSEQLGISTDYDLEELTGGIKELIVNVNHLQTELVKVDSLPVIPNNSKSILFNQLKNNSKSILFTRCATIQRLAFLFWMFSASMSVSGQFLVFLDDFVCSQLASGILNWFWVFSGRFGVFLAD